MKNNALFPCYSEPLKNFLEQKNIRYELVGLHPQSHHMFWVYIKNEKLKNALAEWSIK